MNIIEALRRVRPDAQRAIHGFGHTHQLLDLMQERKRNGSQVIEFEGTYFRMDHLLSGLFTARLAREKDAKVLGQKKFITEMIEKLNNQ